MKYPRRNLFLDFFLLISIFSFGQNNFKHQVFLVGNICDAAKDNQFFNSLENTIKNIG